MINVATVFSGIGAFEQALIKKSIEHRIVFACDNGERELKITETRAKNTEMKKNKGDLVWWTAV